MTVGGLGTVYIWTVVSRGAWVGGDKDQRKYFVDQSTRDPSTPLYHWDPVTIVLQLWLSKKKGRKKPYNLTLFTPKMYSY